MMNVIISSKIVLQEVPYHFAWMIRELLTMPNPAFIEACKRNR